jgi:hypothetical protein
MYITLHSKHIPRIILTRKGLILPILGIYHTMLRNRILSNRHHLPDPGTEIPGSPTNACRSGSRTKIVLNLVDKVCCSCYFLYCTTRAVKPFWLHYMKKMQKNLEKKMR